MGMSLSKLWEIVKDRGAWHTAVYELQRVRYDLVTEQQQQQIVWLNSKWRSEKIHFIYITGGSMKLYAKGVYIGKWI